MNKLKDIVPIQQERDLKELGFNFENEHCYLKEKLSLFKVEEPYDTFDLILFSQAFRWFREKYKLYPEINLHDREDEQTWRFSIIILGEYNLVYNQNVAKEPYYKTYEEAELACLEKLIEIVKNK